jgi:hypothetical protein
VLSQAHVFKERTDMADSAYLRRQAELCLAMAELLSNPVDAKHARSAAEQGAICTAREKRRKTTGRPPIIHRQWLNWAVC